MNYKKIIEDSKRYQIPNCLKPNGWELSNDALKFLAYLVSMMRPKYMLEFGSGYSSLVIAHELEKVDNGRLISIDNSKLWSKKIESQRPQNYEKRLKLCVFPLKVRLYHKKILISYDVPIKFYKKYNKFDLVLVDGPHHDVSREAVLYECFEQVRKDGVFMIDDSNSDHMQETIRKWQKAFGDLIMINYFRDLGKGICIITKLNEIVKKITFPSKELVIDVIKSVRNLYRVSKLRLNQ